MARRERLTKKPLPRTVRKWQNEVRGVRRFLDDLRKLNADVPGEWAKKQRAYYSLRLEDLLQHPPRGRRAATN